MNPDSRDLIAQGKVDHREVESEGSRRQTKSEAVSKVTDTASLDWYLASPRQMRSIPRFGEQGREGCKFHPC